MSYRPCVYVVEGSEDGVIDVFRNCEKAIRRARGYCELKPDMEEVKKNVSKVHKDWIITLYNDNNSEYSTVERWEVV